MKKKISLSFSLAGLLAVILTSVLLSVGFYFNFREQVQNQLQSYTYILQEDKNLVKSHEFNIKDLNDDLRVTLIDHDGKVLYESEGDTSEMDNHLQRPEIIDAIKNGTGKSIRNSLTSGYETMYYAKQLPNGDILRVGKEIRGVFKIFLGTLPMVFLIMIIVITVIGTISWFLTRAIVRPIEKMAENVDDIEDYVAYDELKPFAKKIKSQNKMRSEFTANVSHELKTPLTSISGYAQLISAKIAQGPDVIKFAEKIEQESSQLLNLINDIMKLSQLDEGNSEEILEKVNLLEVAKKCAKRLELKAQNKNIAFQVVGDDVGINGIPSMLEEMIYNLCDNSIRYNKEGGIVIVSVYGLRDKVIFSVKDNGIGIPKEHQEHIFERFYRVDKSHSKETGGTGLGLSIVKHVALYHNGKIQLISQEGKGTEIKIEFRK